MDDTWERRERPILEAVIRRLDEGESGIEDHTVQQDTGMEERDVRVGLRNLRQAGLINGWWNPTEGWVIRVQSVTGDARRLVGVWPPIEPAPAFLAALDAAIRSTDDPDRRSRLVRLRDASVDVGIKVLGEVFARLAGSAIS